MLVSSYLFIDLTKQKAAKFIIAAFIRRCAMPTHAEYATAADDLRAYVVISNKK